MAYGIKFDGHLSVGLLRRGQIRKILADGKFGGKVDSYEELKQLTRSTFYLRGASESIWREAIGGQLFESLVAYHNQKMAKTNPYLGGL